MNDEQTMRLVLERIADRAPASGPVLDGLRYKSQVRRSRRIFLTMAGSAAAVGAVGAVAVVVRSTGGLGGDTAGAAAGLPTTPGSNMEATRLPSAGGTPPVLPRASNDVIDIPLRCRPTWLPSGVVETRRRVTLSVGGHEFVDMTRSWRVAGTDAEFELRVAYRGDVDLTGMRPATIAGRPAWVAARPGDGPLVVWDLLAVPDSYLVVRVTGQVTDPVGVARQIADSVVEDTAGVFEISINPGGMPAWLNQNKLSAEVESVAGVAQEKLTAMDSAGKAVFETVRGAELARPEGGRSARLRGHVGWVRWDTRSHVGWAWVELAADDRLQMRYDGSSGDADPAFDLAAFIQLVDDLQVGPRPDTTWLGKS